MEDKEYKSPEAALPEEFQDMIDGEEVEKVCSVKRKGDRICITKIEGVELSKAAPAPKSQSTESPLATEGKRGKKPSDFMKSVMPAYAGQP